MVSFLQMLLSFIFPWYSRDIIIYPCMLLLLLALIRAMVHGQKLHSYSIKKYPKEFEGLFGQLKLRTLYLDYPDDSELRTLSLKSREAARFFCASIFIHPAVCLICILFVRQG